MAGASALHVNAQVFDGLRRHTVVGYGACVGYCLGLQYQDGGVRVTGGQFGVFNRGPYVGWATKTPNNRASGALSFGAAYLLGTCQ